MAALLLPGLAGNRVGPHRILFDLAEQLSQASLPTLRCDFSGSGYSDGGATASFAELVRDVRDMMDFLQTQLGANRFLVGGICRGARVALASSLKDPRICYLALLSCARLQENSLDAKASRRRKHHLLTYLRKSLSSRWIRRLATGDLNLRAIFRVLLKPIDHTALQKIDVPDESFTLGLLTARTVFIYGERDPDLADSLRYYRDSLIGKDELLTFKTIPGADPGYYSRLWHQAVLEEISEWWTNQSV